MFNVFITQREKLLDWDHRLSAKLASFSRVSIFGQQFNIRQWCFVLEISMHGVPWIIGVTSISIWACFSNRPLDVGRTLIVLSGLLLDITVIGILKLTTRRQRPIYNQNDQFYEAPIADKFSFPSGHSSRAAMLSIIAFSLLKLNLVHHCLLFMLFPQLLAFSRVMMGRHFISDTLAGLGIGVAEALFVLQISLEIAKCAIFC